MKTGGGIPLVFIYKVAYFPITKQNEELSSFSDFHASELAREEPRSSPLRLLMSTALSMFFTRKVSLQRWPTPWLCQRVEHLQRTAI